MLDRTTDDKKNRQGILSIDITYPFLVKLKKVFNNPHVISRRNMINETVFLLILEVQFCKGERLNK